MKLDLTSLTKAINSLEEAIIFLNSSKFNSLNNGEKNIVKAGVIQNFEFTYELCWKFMRRWLKLNVIGDEIEGISRKELFRAAKQNGLIYDIDKWMAFHEARKETSHIYDEDKSDEIVNISKDFLSAAKKLLIEITKRND
ncbi:MAG: nucleotidyltransferase substrate binding protein [Elusimicrobiales bacterium]|nr:nucleotidyltransferase substrate binding protein [Elusimicrobiales bacterium]